jgi:squalene synthase HpnC
MRATFTTRRSSSISASSTPAYTLDEAFDYCAEVTRAHYENFPVASLFLPEDRRPYIQAIYAFSREADDAADEGTMADEERLRRLDAWGEQLERCFQGEAEHPVFIALADTVGRLELPIEPFRDLLAAFRRDVTQHRYATFDDLLGYCRCSANPVGRLVLMIFGHGDEHLFELSDDLCTALQLTNFWQDVDVDRRKGRLYIPEEDMARSGYSIRKWEAGETDAAYQEVMKFQVDRTRELFYRASELPALVGKDLQVELRLVWFGGMKILRRLERRKYLGRPVLGSADKAIILWNGLFRSKLSLYGRRRKPWDLP